MAVYLTVECDFGRCDARLTGTAWAEVKQEALEQGWSAPNQESDIFCLEHRPDKYSPCVVCGRPRRRRGWKKEDHPGTMAWGTKGRCVSCASAEKLGAGAEVRLDRAVERYVEKRSADFAAVLNGPRPLEDEVRKVAPEDLWQTLGI